MVTGRDIQVGYEVADITPVAGDFCSFRLAPNKRSLGVHDRLSLHAVAVEAGGQELLMLSVDGVCLSDDVVERLKSEIGLKTGLASSQIIAAATHTHNGAELFGEEPFMADNPQIQHVIKTGAWLACQSRQNKFSARLGWGYVAVPGVAKNRFANRINGDIDRVDDRIDFLKIDDAAGHYRGMIWHFAAHPTTCMRDGYLSSADYYGQTNRLISEKLGGFCVFFNGACGNVNPELGERSFERAIHYGKCFAEKLLAAIPATTTSEAATVVSEPLTIDIPLNDKPCLAAIGREQILDYFRDMENKNLAPNISSYNGHFNEYQTMRMDWWKHRFIEEFAGKKSAAINLQAHCLAGTLILTVPGEIFIECQLELQRAFPDRRALIFGYANGYFGYIPDSGSYDVDAYETTPSYIHKAGRGAGEKIIACGIELLHAIKNNPGT